MTTVSSTRPGEQARQLPPGRRRPTWPQIPTYLEIEAGSAEDVIRVAGLLGYDRSALTGENTINAYARYGIDLAVITDLKF